MIKLEHFTEEGHLDFEVDHYQTLSGQAGIPRIYANGEDGDYCYMVLELLGPSLEDLLSFCGGTFSLKTVLMLANQLIRRLEHLHLKNIIHRDVKPNNFLMGLGRSGNMVHLIDFGISIRPYPPPADLHSLKPNTVGTKLFASTTGHLGYGEFEISPVGGKLGKQEVF